MASINAAFSSPVYVPLQEERGSPLPNSGWYSTLPSRYLSSSLLLLPERLNTNGRPCEYCRPLLRKGVTSRSVIPKILWQQTQLRFSSDSDSACPIGSRQACVYGLTTTHKAAVNAIYAFSLGDPSGLMSNSKCYLAIVTSSLTLSFSEKIRNIRINEIGGLNVLSVLL